jgi:hypothetical protein
MMPMNKKGFLIMVRKWTLLSVCFLPLLAFADVVGRGLNQHGQITIPAEAADAIAVDAGREFSMAIRPNGSLVAWGNNSDGRALPPANLGNIVSLSSGTYHTLALKSDGTVTGWGYAGNGILKIPAGLSDVLAVAAGGYHSLAVKRDGTVIGWGYTGNGRTVAPSTLTDVIAIGAGRDHSVALKSDGTVVAWGLNDLGQTTVPEGLGGVIAMSVGENHTLVLKSDGTVSAWGLNTSGQCNVPATLTGVVAVAAGSQHSLALKSDGTIVGWGSNGNGQRTFTGNTHRSIAAGGFHSLAVRGTGPLITSQPLSRTVLAGDAVNFVVAASGAALSYQWQFNGQDLPGQVAPTLAIAEAGRENAGVYTVKVTNTGGSVYSANAVLIVRGLQQIAAPQMLAGGVLRLVFGDQHGDDISAPNVSRYQVEASADLQTWETLNLPLQLVNGQLQVDDPDAISHPQRFYRVREK